MGKLKELESVFRGKIEELGYGLYHMEYVYEEGNHVLRFYIEKDEGITLEDCEKASRIISDILDEEDPIVEDYNLEVSSPGIFRPLITKDHMRRVIGEKVTIKAKKPVSGKKNFVAVLKAVNEQEILVERDKEELTIPFENIKKMNLEVDL